MQRIPHGIRSSLVVMTICITWAGTVSAQVAGDLKCYTIRDELKPMGTADINTPQFGTDATCKISKARLFCVPASKENVSVIDKSTGDPITPTPITGPNPGDRICYRVKCLAPVANQQVTDEFGTRMLSKFKVSFVCTTAFKGSARFVDNGDGTVTDNQTGLMWEKKVGGAGCLNCVSDTYTWNAGMSEWLSLLNGHTDVFPKTPGFAGYSNWRLPTLDELFTIFDPTSGACGGGSGPCINPTFGPTGNFRYWTATTRANSPGDAFIVQFDGNGNPMGSISKGDSYFVRGVRGGS